MIYPQPRPPIGEVSYLDELRNEPTKVPLTMRITFAQLRLPRSCLCARRICVIPVLGVSAQRGSPGEPTQDLQAPTFPLIRHVHFSRILKPRGDSSPPVVSLPHGFLGREAEGHQKECAFPQKPPPGNPRRRSSSDHSARKLSGLRERYFRLVKLFDIDVLVRNHTNIANKSGRAIHVPHPGV